METALQDKVVLVTGGAVRVGRTIALALAKAGCDVVIHYRHSSEEANTLAEDIRELGRDAWTLHADLSVEDAPQTLFRSAWDATGWIDILVNNAAAYSRQGLMDADEADYLAHWRLNTLAPILLAKTFAECVAASAILPEDYLGHVINILDRHAATCNADALPYWLSKKSLDNFTIAAARAMAPRFAVNAIAPGPGIPPLPPYDHEKAGDLLLADRPTPDDIAHAVLFLASSRAITGQRIIVDSGQHLLKL